MCFVCLFVFVFCRLGLELRANTLSHSTSPFLWWVFFNIVSQTICLGWLWTAVLLISAPWVAGITGVSHLHPAYHVFFK
jgi:hypothetical protein